MHTFNVTHSDFLNSGLVGRERPGCLIWSINMLANRVHSSPVYRPGAREQNCAQPQKKPNPIRPTRHDIYIKQDRQGPQRGGGGGDTRVRETENVSKREKMDQQQTD